MASRTAWTLGILLAQAIALVATFPVSSLGTVWWHHLASLGLVAVGTVTVRGRMHDRAFLGVGVLATTILATVSGFYLLYWKEGIRVDGYQDWGVWWHVLWSWAAAVFFWQHTWVNRRQYAHFFAASLRSARTAIPHLGAYAAAVIGFVVTGTVAKAAFVNENYIPLSIWTWLGLVAVAYVTWFVARRGPTLPWRRGVDLALVPAAAIATLSGLPLLWFGDALDGAGLKYASKYWHVGPSILFAVLVYVHSVQLWTGMRRHWASMAAKSH